MSFQWSPDAEQNLSKAIQPAMDRFQAAVDEIASRGVGRPQAQLEDELSTAASRTGLVPDAAGLAELAGRISRGEPVED